MPKPRAVTNCIYACWECRHMELAQHHLRGKNHWANCYFDGNMRALTYSEYRHDLPDWCPLPLWQDLFTESMETKHDMEMQCQ